MGALRKSVTPLVILNLIAFAIAGVAFVFGGDFKNAFFLVMMAETGFVLVSAGLEDVRSTPTGVQIRRAIFKRVPPYSPERHKEALGTANVMIALGGLLFAETIAISLAVLGLRV